MDDIYRNPSNQLKINKEMVKIFQYLEKEELQMENNDMTKCSITL